MGWRRGGARGLPRRSVAAEAGGGGGWLRARHGVGGGAAARAAGGWRGRGVQGGHAAPGRRRRGLRQATRGRLWISEEEVRLPRNDAGDCCHSVGDGGRHAPAPVLAPALRAERRLDPRAAGGGRERAHAPHDLHGGGAAEVVRARPRHRRGKVRCGKLVVGGQPYGRRPTLAPRTTMEDMMIVHIVVLLAQCSKGRLLSPA